MINRLRRFFVIVSTACGLLACASPEQSAPSGRSARATASPAAPIPDPSARFSRSVNCNAQPEPGQPQYIVGYGSLMQDESRKRTSPQAGPAYPVEVSGYRRGWFEAGTPAGFSTTFLGALPDPRSHLNAVIYRVEASELKATDQREASYCRKSVPASDLTMLTKAQFDPRDGQTWIYASRPELVVAPSARFPIVKSYVDIFLSGCIEQEQRFELHGFAQKCLTSTHDWSEHWVNDRLYPRRPFIFQPRSREIDLLLHQQLAEYVSRIKIE